MTHYRSLFLILAVVLASDSSLSQEIDSRLASGEFVAARRIAGRLVQRQRDPLLAQIASAQARSGESVSAGRTVRDIESNESRQSALAANDSAIVGGQGGGSFADFQSLMDLIQTTVVPDTWEALGGPSTMSPYPQGVYVDPAGTLHACEALPDGDAVADLKALLAAPQQRAPLAPDAWRNPADLRCVSLRRLMDERTQHQLNRTRLPDALRQLAGLSRVQYVFIGNDDIVIAGPVGGIDSRRGWYHDRASGRTPLRLDFLSTCIEAALGQHAFGCTIDPTTAALQRAAVVADAVQRDQIPIGKAAQEMVSALGMQRVEVFGTAGDTPIGYVMVEADRHMKQLALGIEPMPEGVDNYLDVIAANIEQGPPQDLLLRLWFTANPRAVRRSSDNTVFEIAGTPIRLSGQNERALASGQRGFVTRDQRTEAFVAIFNRHWNAIRAEYPIYGALESIYRAASTAELLRRYADSPALQSLLAGLSSGSSQSSFLMPTPRQVETIATLHTIRQARKRHHVLIASGGVAVDTRGTLAGRIDQYAPLAAMADPVAVKPPLVQRWWWDL